MLDSKGLFVSCFLKLFLIMIFYKHREHRFSVLLKLF